MADPKVGTGKKPKGSGRRLYTDENPSDTVGIKFATPESLGDLSLRLTPPQPRWKCLGRT